MLFTPGSTSSTWFGSINLLIRSAPALAGVGILSIVTAPAAADPINLPAAGIYTEYLAQVREIEGFSERWVATPGSDSILDPALTEQLVTTYNDPGFFDLASRAGYAGGLGVRAVADLPPIDFEAEIVQIRSNALVKSRTVRHYTATSLTGGDVPIDVVVAAHGSFGYDPGPGGEPYAFERILDAGFDMNVRVHRGNGSVQTVWSGGAILGRFNDVDLPLNAYGSLASADFRVNGFQVDLQIFDFFSDVFNAQDGETFAIEYELIGRARNYEYPNATAFAEFFNSASFLAAPEVPEHVLDSPLFATLGDRPASPIAAHTNLRGFAGHTHYQTGTRPPLIIPEASDVATASHAYEQADSEWFANAYATVNPLGPGGALGAVVSIHNTPATNPGAVGPDATSVFPVAAPSYTSIYYPTFDGPAPTLIDVDLELRLHGTLELNAHDAAAFAALTAPTALASFTEATVEFRGIVSSSSKTRQALHGVVTVADGDPDKIFFVHDGNLLQDLVIFQPHTDENGEVIGGTLLIDIDTRLLPADHPLVQKLQNVLTIVPEDYVEIVFGLEVSVRIETEDMVLVESVIADFFNTMEPSLATDTPGVTFVHSAIPEPASVAMLGLGLALVLPRRAVRR